MLKFIVGFACGAAALGSSDVRSIYYKASYQLHYPNRAPAPELPIVIKVKEPNLHELQRLIADNAQ